MKAAHAIFTVKAKQENTHIQFEGTKITKWYVQYQIEKRWHVRRLIRKCLVFLVYFSIFLIIMSMQRDIEKGFLFEEGLQEEIADQMNSKGLHFMGITTPQEFWDWTEDVFVPLVYEKRWYNGELKDENTLHTVGMHNSFVGGVRLRQTRSQTENNNSCLESSFDKINARCLTDEENQEPFGSNATFITTDNDVNVTKIIPGFEYTYDEVGIGGYQVNMDLNSDIDAELHKIEDLKAHKWIDEYTRLVEIDATFYNPNIKLWGICSLEIEFGLEGQILPKHRIQVVLVEPYNFNDKKTTIRTALEIVYVITTAGRVLHDVFNLISLFKHRSTGQFDLKTSGITSTMTELTSTVLNIAIILKWIDFLNL
jgi:hypothetical protein